ncbi:MAG TPA: hypothetical protein VJW95_02320 [Dissulfurispiraceae bacterium]|nr:hypothetical protein [Dissulfurispiraceae bacterium]
MNIDTAITLNMPGPGSQNSLQANSGPTVNNKADSSGKDNTLSNQKQDPEKTTGSSQPAVSGPVGRLALDDDKNVVVRFYDAKGNIVAQYPPKDYLDMIKEFNQVTQNLFHTTA